jgi:predicted nucleotidyltransferase
VGTINLSPDQIEAICRWAEMTPRILEVWLFGSRAKGTACPNSDIDLAITPGGEDVDGEIIRNAQRWRDELATATRLPIDLQKYGPDVPNVFAWCQEASVLLYRSGGA